MSITESLLLGGKISYTKVLGRLRFFNPKPKYHHQVQVHNALGHTYLSPRTRGEEWYIKANNQDIEDWFKDNGKGLMRFKTHLNIALGKQTCVVKVDFTDAETAMVFKLTFGGI